MTQKPGSISLLQFLALLGGLTAPPQFTSSVNQVEIYASVTDQAGRPVSGLRVEDFEVREDGVMQRISVFAEADFPLSAAIALDSSFSMTGERLAVAKSAARIFIGALRPDDQAMLMSIGGKVDVIAPLSTDRGEQFRAIDALRSWGTTSLHDAIIEAIDQLQPAKGRRALVILSDGDDRYSEATAAGVIARAPRRRHDLSRRARAIAAAALHAARDAHGRARLPSAQHAPAAADAARDRRRAAQAVPDWLRAVARRRG